MPRTSGIVGGSIDDQALLEYFKFTQDDLYANRNGRFTDKQMAHVIARDKSARSSGRGWGIFLMAIGLMGLGIAIAAGIANNDWGFRIGFRVGFGVIWPVVWGGIGYMMMADSFTKHEFKLARVQGRANIIRNESYSSSSHTTSVSYELHLGGHEFTVEDAAADVFFQGDEYIIYYVDSTDEIMSVEHVARG